MGDFNQLLASRYAELTRRLFGEDIQVDTVTPEILLAVVLELDRPEYSYSKSEQLFALALSQPLNAGLNSAIRIRNPVDSGMLFVVEHAIASPSIATECVLSVGISNADLPASAANGRARDTRIRIGDRTLLAASKAVISRDNNSGGFAPFLEMEFVPAATALAFQSPPIVMDPGSVLQMHTVVNNVVLDGTFVWSERPLKPEER